MLVAAAAMAFASCQKEEAAAPETVSATLTMHADVEQTKTYLGEDNAVLWGKGEAVTLYVGSGETAKFFDSTSTDDHDGEASASFTFAIEDVAQADSYALGGIYPESAAMDDNKNAAQYKVILPATQNQVDGNYDPSAYIMVLKPEVVTELPAEYTASFRRAVALNKITLKGLKETITSVTITVPEEKFLAGRRYFDLTTGEEGEIYHAQSNSITVNGTYAPGEVDVWFTSWGVELAQGEQMTVKMTSTTKTYTRTITVNENGVRFVEGDLNTLTVNMSSATEETLDNFSGEYLIVNTDLTRAAQAWAGGNNLPEFVLNARDGVVYESEGIENCKMTIEAQADGKYTIKDANGLYLYAASSSSNHLKGQAEASSWTIEQDGDKYILTSSAQTSRNIMKYNEQSKIFSCYSSGQKDITLYKYSDIEVDTTPSISLTKNSDEVAYDATSYDFTYTTKNITGNVAATIKDGATMTNVSASASNGTVTVKFDANDDAEQKTATIVLSYEGAVSQEFVLTQAGKPVEGGESTVATWSWDGGGKSDFTGGNIYETYGLGSDYAASHAPYQIKMDGTGDYFIIKVDGAIQSASVGVKMVGGASTSTLQVLGSSDGDSFTSVEELSISGSQNAILELVTTKQFDPSYRYLKFNFIKGSNIGVGPITITYIPENSEGGETPEQPTQTPRGLAFSSESATATIGQVFDAPTLIGVTDGVQYSSSNTAVATVNASTGAVTLVGAGTTTITATAPETEQYEAGTASYTLTVSAAPEGGEDSSGTITVSNTIADIADANGWVNSTQYENINLDDVITATVSGGGNTGKYYTSGENWRIYQNENPTLVISAADGYTIKTVKITYTINNTGVLTYNNSNIASDSVVDVNAASIAFGVGNTGSATNGQVRVTAIEVVYQKN